MNLFSRLVNAIRDIIGAVDEKVDAIQMEYVTKKLDERAETSDAKNWRTSVVDLMKLAGLDSSMERRRELARDLGRFEPFSGNPYENMWLHREVLKKLAEHKIPMPPPG